MGQSKKPPVIVWFRRDLRLSDNPALCAAVETGAPIIPLYLQDHSLGGRLGEGEASQWWLHKALHDLDQQITEVGGRLLILSTDAPQQALLELTRKHKASAVLWNRRYEPDAVATDTEIKHILLEEGIEARSFGGSLLNEPTKITNQSGKPFQVFTPFWKHCITIPVSDPLPAPELRGRFTRIKGERVEQLDLLPKIPWYSGFRQQWNATRSGADHRIQQFIEQAASNYLDQRDIPAIDGTSTLSPWLHFGQISVREIVHHLRSTGVNDAEKGIIRQLYWRDFAHHLMFHFPHSMHSSLRKEYDQFPWSADDALAERWRRGKTGYPIVDAGMRQLWDTGWMHNRVRMIVGSFLVKHLLQPWQTGADWFANTLVDADLANNIMGWQWVAGSGADAAPYFRIFNPITQALKFDPEGNYVRKHLPELAHIPGKAIHQPWLLPQQELQMAGVELGTSYPHRMIELAEGRQRALDAYQEFKNRRG